MTYCILLNPTAGRGAAGTRRKQLETLLQHYSGGNEWRIRESTKKGDATRIASEEATRGTKVIAIAGGDGTLGEALNGVFGKQATLAILPMGTGNDIARCIGIGTNLEFAVDTLFHGECRAIDVGMTDNHYFLNVAGCGFDAVVADRVNRGFKFLTGTAAYYAAVVLTLFTYRAAKFCVSTPEQRHEFEGMLCSIANANSYGGGMLIAPDAKMDDGYFDVCMLSKAGIIEFLRAFPRVFRGEHTSHPKVTMLRSNRVTVESQPPMPVLLDGDVFGNTPKTFTILPRSQSLLYPTEAMLLRRRATLTKGNSHDK